jgi:molybdopterin-guanine dinucleotide biosynthesis protein A
MTLTAVLLTGGLSRRMGADKATLTLAGEPWWARQLCLLRELQPGALWVSARTPPEWCPREIEVVPDEWPSVGPLSGVAAALQKMRTSHLLVLAIDLPQMTTEHLRTLVARAAAGPGVVPLNRGRFEPLCAVYPAQAASMAVDALKSSDFSLHSFVATLLRQDLVQTFQPPDSEKSLYQNANTPDDLAKQGASGQSAGMLATACTCTGPSRPDVSSGSLRVQ